ncbi:MAG: YdgA family protein [Pseudazoarcus pumilus]|nr:YdgA family protein [Pseudazoarcus pumilus]
MKIVLRITAALAVLVVAYVLAAFGIGRVLVSETGQFADALSQQDGVTVHRLEYEAGVFNGVLRYELDYIPPPESLLAVTEWPGVRNARGEMVVRHGPWVGDGFALAAGDGRAEVPADLRTALPELAADQPLLDVALRVHFDRSVRTDFRVPEHEGPLVLSDASGARGTAQLKGASGWAQFDAALNWLDFSYGVEALHAELTAPAEEAARLAFNGLRVQAELQRAGDAWTGTLNTALDGFDFGSDEGAMRLEQLLADVMLGVAPTAAGPRPHLKATLALQSFVVDTLGEQAASLRVGKVRGEADLVEDWPQLWSGTSSAHASNIETASNGLSVRTSQISLDSIAARRGALVDQTVNIVLGPLQWGQNELGGGRLSMTLNGMNGASLSRLLEVMALHDNVPPQATEQDVHHAMMLAAESAFAGTPLLSFDHVDLSVLQQDDIRSNLSLSLSAPTTTPVNWQELPARLKVQGNLTAQLAAVNQLFRLAADAEHHGKGLDPAAVREIGDARYAHWLAGIRELPYVTVTEDRLTSDVGFANDVLTFNGQQVDPMLLMLMLGMLGGGMGQ